MDIKIGGKAIGRIVILLRTDVVPLTAGVYEPLAQETKHVATMLHQRWTNVADGGPILMKHWVNKLYYFENPAQLKFGQISKELLYNIKKYKNESQYE